MTIDKQNFRTLICSILEINGSLASQASRAVNSSLTLRNWLIGCHIAEFELYGADRAEYGDRLLAALAEELESQQISNCGKRQLYRYLSFYRSYPQIVGAVSTQSALLPEKFTKNGYLGKVGTASAQLTLAPETLLAGLSYSHFEILFGIEDELKRAFYEIECLRGQWSIRELRRQVASLYFERSSLSKNKEKLAKLIQSGVEQTDPVLTIRDPYIFEFLGVRAREVMGESDLEDALLAKLQEFLLEMGPGFCFEARQKRILIGDTHFFVDLVFYHRILKCHVLIELKVDEFSHEHIGQLNTYVSWFKENVMTEGDNPPIGLLLCTRKNHPLVEYALAGMDNHLFVSKYQLNLPQKEKIEHFLEEQLRENG